MARSILIFSIGLCMLSLVACKQEAERGTGTITTQNRTVDSFDVVNIDVTVDAKISVGADSFAISITTHDNLHEYIKTEVVNNKLRIYKEGGILHKDHIEIQIQMPSIKALETHGATDVEIDGIIAGEVFTLDMNGAADVEIDNVNVELLNVSLSGASELDIKQGKATKAIHTVSGAGEIYAEGLRTEYTKAKVSGAGEMSLHVTDTLDVVITGAGEIEYIGKPHIISKVTGAGTLTNKN